MYTALDGYGKTVSIEDANNRTKYLCKYCMSELILKNQGTIRAHHFAHKAGSPCSDSWARERVYDEISVWHKNWQSLFPSENQEVTLAFGGVRHRGDVVTGRTVIEFQHSSLSHKDFDKRTNFYHDCDCNVIWLFDLVEDFERGKIYSTDENHFIWTNTRRTFDYLDDMTGVVDVFFQLKEDVDDQKCIIRIKNIEGENFERFEIDRWYTREEFLDYIGRKDGEFAPPDLTKIDKDPLYIQFKEDHKLSFNAQQDRAIQKTDGVTLLLAVPGSGKTTTLIGKLGYMTLCKGIDPKSILAITYTKAGAVHMREKFSESFGKEIGDQISFKTINAFCNTVVTESIGKQRICDEDKQKVMIRNLFKKINNDEHPQETDLMNTASSISYVKNLMLDPNDLEGFDTDIPNFGRIYEAYEEALKNQSLIDFDDQMILALKLLNENPVLLDSYQERYKYICVDEVQDTSKLQHEILKLLCDKYNNLFLVGDEDQSIFGYRGAFPQALLDIRSNYRNPFVLKLETNYRSKEEIVKIASDFIERNPNHIQKDMVSARGKGGSVKYIEVKSRLDQFEEILKICKQNTSELAIIYRNNDSVLPLIDMFERNGIPFLLNKFKDTFFSSRVVTDIRSFMRFALNHNDQKLLMEIYYKFKMGFERQRVEWTCGYARRKKADLLDEFVEQAQYYKNDGTNWKHKARMGNALAFSTMFNKFPEMKPDQVISALLSMGYGDYAKEHGYNIRTAEILIAIAKNTSSISEFLQRLDFLKNYIEDQLKSDHAKGESNKIVLSTIHSVKGLEYESVIVFDVIDSILPSRNSLNLRSADIFWSYEEERRLFYVTMTRAKDNLMILSVSDEGSEFISEVNSGRWRCPDLLKPENTDSRGVFTFPLYIDMPAEKEDTAKQSSTENNMPADNADDESGIMSEQLRNELDEWARRQAEEKRIKKEKEHEESKRAQEELQRLERERPKTINDLWALSYKLMVAKNVQTGKEFILDGSVSGLLRKYRTTDGLHCRGICLNRAKKEYMYSEAEILSDDDQPVWKLVKAVTKECCESTESTDSTLDREDGDSFNYSEVEIKEDPVMLEMSARLKKLRSLGDDIGFARLALEWLKKYKFVWLYSEYGR